MDSKRKKLIALTLGLAVLLLVGVAVWINPRLLRPDYLRLSTYSTLVNPYTFLISAIVLISNILIKSRAWSFFSQRSFSLLAIFIIAAPVSIFLFMIGLPVSRGWGAIVSLVALAIAIISTSVGLAALYFFAKGSYSAKQKRRWDVYYPFIVFVLLGVGIFLPTIQGYLGGQFPCDTECGNTIEDKRDFIQYVAENGSYVKDPYVGRVFYKKYSPHTQASFDTVLSVAKETGNPEACDFMYMHETLCRIKASGQDEDRAIQKILSRAKNGDTSSCSRLMSYDELMPEVRHNEIKIGNPRTRQINKQSASIVVPFKSRKGRYFNDYELEKYYKKDSPQKELVSSDYYEKFLETYFKLNYCVDNEKQNCERNQDLVYVPQDDVETNPTFTLSINKQHHPPKDLMREYLKPKLISEEYCQDLAESN